MSLPEYTAFKRAAAIPSSVIEEVCNRFLDEATKNPNEYYTEDVERIRVNNWSVGRYLIGNKSDAERALNTLIETMKWRKSFGVLDLKESDFPKELYLSAYIFEYGIDLAGAPVMISRVKVAKKSTSWNDTTFRYCVFLHEKLDRKCAQTGYTSLLYCKNAGFRNVDLEGVNIGLKLSRDYYPGLRKVQLVHEMPAMLEPIVKAFTWFNVEDIIVTNKKNINDYIARDQLPDFMLGTNQLSYRTVPESAPTADELAKRLGLEEGETEKLVKHLKPFITD